MEQVANQLKEGKSDMMNQVYQFQADIDNSIQKIKVRF